MASQLARQGHHQAAVEFLEAAEDAASPLPEDLYDAMERRDDAFLVMLIQMHQLDLSNVDRPLLHHAIIGRLSEAARMIAERPDFGGINLMTGPGWTALQTSCCARLAAGVQGHCWPLRLPRTPGC